jgi:hypothetical protein
MVITVTQEVMAMRKAPQLQACLPAGRQATDDERTHLHRWARGRRTPVRVALRAKMILLAAAVSADRQEGHENRSIAATVGTSRQTVGLWRPCLPMKKGRCGTMTHDDKRHGTTTLFAALSMLDGTVTCLPTGRGVPPPSQCRSKTVRLDEIGAGHLRKSASACLPPACRQTGQAGPGSLWIRQEQHETLHQDRPRLS